MMQVDHIPEALPDWIREHMQTYLESGGKEGHFWRGVPTLLLKTIGRRSGRPSVLPLIYGRHNDDYVIVASKGGAPEHPAWYLNLKAEPHVEVQVGTHHFAAETRDALDDERPHLWQEMSGIWPQYDDYAKATDRQIPIVVLEFRGDL
jgi:deazaflavin-dependent oxidoreductase (nitroreductase family)